MSPLKVSEVGDTSDGFDAKFRGPLSTNCCPQQVGLFSSKCATKSQPSVTLVEPPTTTTVDSLSGDAQRNSISVSSTQTRLHTRPKRRQELQSSRQQQQQQQQQQQHEASSQMTRDCPVPQAIAFSIQRPVSPVPSEASPPRYQQSSTNHRPASIPSRDRKTRFLVFVKILFKCLEQAKETALRDQAKRIVFECTRRNRMGDPQVTPLTEAIDKRLRPVVGETYWRRSLFLLHRFVEKQRMQEADCEQQQSPPIPLEIPSQQHL